MNTSPRTAPARAARRGLYAVRDSSGYLAYVSAVDRLALMLAATERGPRSSYLTVIATRGEGNIGDQVMLDTCLAKFEGPFHVVVQSKESFDLQTESSGGVVVHVHRNLTGTRLRPRLFAMVRFWRVVLGGRALVVIGADVMDGGCSVLDSVERASLVTLAARAGVPARVLGFSCDAHADPRATAALQAAGCHADLVARDPVSLARLTAAGVTARQGADLAFLYDRGRPITRLAPWLDVRSHLRLALVNMSGLLARDRDLSADYEELLRWLLDHGFAVVLVPHVVRRGDDDAAALASLYAKLDPRHVRLLDRRARPDEIRWLVSRADLVVSGRVQLAVLALSVGCPAFVVASQGDVEGLAELFGLPQMVVEPTAGFAARVTSLIDESGPQSWRHDVEDRLAEVRALATENVTALR